MEAPVTPYALQNLKLYNCYGADVVYKKTILRTGLDFYVTGRLMRRNACCRNYRVSWLTSRTSNLSHSPFPSVSAS